MIYYVSVTSKDESGEVTTSSIRCYSSPQISVDVWPDILTSIENRIIELLKLDKKVQAVKLVREVTGFDLRKSKDLVDQIERNQ